MKINMKVAFIIAILIHAIILAVLLLRINLDKPSRPNLGKGDIIETYLFRIGIQEGQYDLAAAMGLFNSVISLVLVLIANKLIQLIGGDSIW